ncbi:MAG: flagellar basal body-associated FliL family protein [candidate division Zixibacteria bacterium]|nr:flagellar basal body-associated FliL family protein [candidate division Zixibacteria bacterium]
MPDEAKEKDEQTGDEEESSDSKGEQNPFVKYGIMIGIVLVMAVAGYFVTLNFIRPMVTGNQTEEIGDSDESDENESEPAPKKKKKSTKKKKKKLRSAGDEGQAHSEMFEIKDIIVNPAGTGGTRFLSASISFEVEDSQALELFESRTSQIRDALITILGSKNIEQLTDVKQKEIARYQIKKRVETLLNTDELMAVYFTDFVLQ